MFCGIVVWVVVLVFGVFLVIVLYGYVDGFEFDVVVRGGEYFCVCFDCVGGWF